MCSLEKWNSKKDKHYWGRLALKTFTWGLAKKEINRTIWDQVKTGCEIVCRKRDSAIGFNFRTVIKTNFTLECG